MPGLIQGSYQAGPCDVCGVSLKVHPKCQGCGALAGPGHATKELYQHQGKEVCLSCATKWGFLEDVVMSGQAVSLKQCIGAEVGGRPRGLRRDSL